MNEQNETILQPETETNISPNQVTIRRRGAEQLRKKKKAKTKATAFMILRRTGLCLLTLVLVLVIGAWLILNMLFNGTNDNVRKVLCMSLREPSGTKWLPALFIGKDGVAAIEKSHEERYRKLLHNVEAKAVFEKSGVTLWECRNCGHLVMGVKAPDVCPVCKHAQAYFEVRAENY